jgi:hypothetical protein
VGDEVSTDPAIHPLVKWEAPKQEYVKVNIDAIFQEESRSGPGALSYVQIKELFLQAQLVRIEHVKSASRKHRYLDTYPIRDTVDTGI